MTGKVSPTQAYGDTERLDRSFVAQHTSLVKRIAHHLLARLPESVQLDDLVQAGMVGLLEAAAKYDQSKGASFETYAGIRIRGAMLDEMRRGDWVPRSVHKNARKIAEATRQVEAELGRVASGAEVASSLGLSAQDYHRMLNDTRSARLFSFEELTDASEEPGVEQEGGVARDHEKQVFQRHLAKAIATLSEREQLVMSLYYGEELNLKEIGVVLEVSESRVSQIMSQAAARIRARLTDWQEEGAWISLR